MCTNFQEKKYLSKLLLFFCIICAIFQLSFIINSAKIQWSFKWKEKLLKNLKIGIRFNLDLPSIGKFKTKVSARNKLSEIEYTLISLPLYLCFNLPELLRG